MDCVTFFGKIQFPRHLLETYSKLYHDACESNPSQIISDINMPNLIGNFQEQTFENLKHVLYICSTNTESKLSDKIESISLLAIDIGVPIEVLVSKMTRDENELEQAFLLAIALDMPIPIEVLIHSSDKLLCKYIQRLDVFEACCNCGKPFKLLQRILAQCSWELRAFALGKLSVIIQKERELKNPSNEIIYLYTRNNGIQIFWIDKQEYIPVPGVCIKGELPKATQIELESWIKSCNKNKMFFKKFPLTILSYKDGNYYQLNYKDPRANPRGQMVLIKYSEFSEVYVSLSAKQKEVY